MSKTRFNLKVVQGMTLEQFKGAFSHIKGLDLENEYKKLNPSKNKAELSSIKEDNSKDDKVLTDTKKVS